MMPLQLNILRTLANVEQELEDSAPIDRLRLLAMVRQVMVDLASLEVPAQTR